jgi:N-acetylneuraminic acid mutarotase
MTHTPYSNAVAARSFLAIIFITFTFIAEGQSWADKAIYPANADGAFCFTINNEIYVGGGIGSKQFRQYDPVLDTWTLKATLPASADRSFATAFSINGRGYLCAGLDGSTQKKDLWEYDPTANTWTQKTDFPGMARDGMFCFVIGGKAYIGAGEDAFTTAQYKSVYLYDPAANAWTQKNDYPTSGVIYPFSFVISGMGYVSCGYQVLEVTTTYQYNPAADTWTSKADYTGSARQAGVSFVLNNKVYCGLGMDQTSFFKDFYTYDPTANSWAADISLPDSGRSFPGAAVANGHAYAGIGWSYTTTDVYHKDWWEYSVPSGITSLEANSANFQCFPNPSTGTLNIKPANDQLIDGTVGLYDLSGRQIFGTRWRKEKLIDISALPAGLYLLELKTGNEDFQTKLFLNK